ncbi:MAG: hypothetical protein GIX03_07095 [Candidatus Eremiobacteraeota bacterium]|nr:hypothetical protein [Candidatus Eremiobacteraeota bacterium]MBC5802758.1 hypothetical protein [Candidatus Eremiobacteraeota bacterium]MBC5821271.1 hypothetical protein [Candidatus Eremiobacteraeota bacterium]
MKLGARAVLLSLLCIVALVALQGITVVAIERVAMLHSRVVPAQAHLGYYINPATWGKITVAVVVGSNCLEALALYGLFRFLPAQRTPTIIKACTAAGVAAMLGISLSARLTGLDAILYIYFAKVANLGTAYHVPPSFTPVADGFGNLYPVIRKLRFASPYGPLWELFNRGILAGTHTIGQALFTIKIANAAALLACFAVLFFLRLPFRLTALFFLNPALYDNYIVQAHNDLFAILPILVALLVARRGALTWAALLASLAGLVKISLTVVALATIASLGNRRKRLVSASLIIAVLALGSALIGGAPYLHALTFVGKSQTAGSGSRVINDVRLVLQALMLVGACFALLDAVLWKRVVRSAVWTLPAFSGLLHAWYFPWTVPFAVRFGVTAAALAISLPLSEIATNLRLTDLIKVDPLTLSMLIIVAVAARELIATKGRGEAFTIGSHDDEVSPRRRGDTAMGDSTTG